MTYRGLLHRLAEVLWVSIIIAWAALRWVHEVRVRRFRRRLHRYLERYP